MGRDITFDNPKIALLIFMIIPMLLGQFFLWRHRRKIKSSYASASLLPRLLVDRSQIYYITKSLCWGLIWFLSCIALMGPLGNIRYFSSDERHRLDGQSGMAPHQVIFLVDTSASMRVPDGYNGQSRLKSAQVIMEDIVQQLHGETLSLYAFTSELTQVVPPTLDYIFARLAIHELQIDQGDVGGTRFEPVLKALKQQAFPEPSSQRYTLLIFSDGGDTDLESLGGNKHEIAEKAILSVIPNPEEFHLRLFAIGLGGEVPKEIPKVVFDGKPVLSKLDSGILQKLAKHGHGKYYDAEKWSSWDLTKELIKQIHGENGALHEGEMKGRSLSQVGKEERVADLYFQIPLGIAILFYLLNLLLPDVRKL